MPHSTSPPANSVVYHIPLARLTAYSGRSLIVRSTRPPDLVAQLGPEDLENLAYVQLCSLPDDTDDLINWAKALAIELLVDDPAREFAELYRYPDYRFGNILECDSLSELLNGSAARQRFVERPVKLMQGDCIQCDYLTLCHGGCPVRTYSVHRTLFEKDPYCHLYKTLFRHLENRAAQRLADIR